MPLPPWFHVPRTLLALALAVVAALAVTLAIVQWWVSHAVYDEDRFASVAVEVSQRRDVQLELRRVLVEQVLEAQPDLVGVRPLLETAIDAVLSSGASRPIVADGARELHRILFQTDRRSIVLTLSDVMTLVVAGVRAYDADIADRIPGGASIGVVPLTERNAATRIMEIDRRLDALRWLVAVTAAGSAIAALAIAPSRRSVMAAMGISLVFGAIVCWLAIGVVADIVRDSVPGNPVGGEAARAAWNMYAEGLTWWMWVQAITGVLVATIATSAQAAVPARVRFQQASEIIEAGWSRRGLRVVMAGVLMIAGVIALVSPLVALRVSVQAMGLAFLYAGGVEVVRGLGLANMHLPRRKTAPAPAPAQPSTARMPQVFAGAALCVGLVAIGGVFWLNRDSLSVAEEGERPPIENCNGYAELCDRRLDEIAWAASHNSMSAAEEPGWFLANHTRGIPAQLNDGIRVFLIDLYYGFATNNGVRTDPTAGSVGDRFEGGLGPDGAAALARLVDSIGPIPPGAEPSLYLCHGFCELGATPFDTTLRQLESFLVNHPDEVVILFLQDYIDPFDVEAAFVRARLIDYVYTLVPGEPLPTPREMIEFDRRVVVLSENVGDQDAPPWYHDGFAFTQETPFLFRNASQLSCEPNRGDEDAPFFLFNHWLTTPLPSPSDVRLLNDYDFMLERARQCEEECGQLPNFIAVNFYESGDTFRVVDTLNGIGE